VTWLLRIITRLALAGLVMAGLGAVLIYGTWKLAHPFLLQHGQKGEIARLERRVEQLKREHKDLKEAARRLATEKGRAEELRRLGYVRPKERIIRFLKGPSSSEAPAPVEPQPAAGGVKDRIKHWLEGRLRPATEAGG
jgi:cell division protein FtsB